MTHKKKKTKSKASIILKEEVGIMEAKNLRDFFFMAVSENIKRIKATNKMDKFTKNIQKKYEQIDEKAVKELLEENLKIYTLEEERDIYDALKYNNSLLEEDVANNLELF